MYVKICGMTTIEAAQEAVRAGTDFIGFVFAPSKRQLTPKKAAAISKEVPSSVKKVGVFVNETRNTIIQTAETARLDIIQLHGDEPAAFAESLPYPVIKAFRMGKHDPGEIQAYPCDYYLIDSPKGPNRGGNGTTFDWSRLADAGLDMQKTILAGGLNPENVQTAISTAKPTGVDVSSGVETDGLKDLEKINQFINNAKMKG
ncbi:N-(5'-phosphoribosyl)anthranilate isomerase [Lentibacillus kapialis]|uniref:N-(5'-phosphoribosyl)anthranilate isomerase n=1 Tax=Lentibacillus kapialis TaxID=340214 RepID=A0A917UW62_9BACI|nr:phosphoribosylanthranilate isomerase [Lentibacillus kapialis]GGJ89118.1 N-(5'-phosphoribosyl)anthranilate isomerase [Lentibacillus kapialis]